MLFDSPFRFLVDVALVDNLASLEDSEAVSKAKHERNMLFDDKHGHALLLACHGKHFRHPIDNRRLKPFRDFVEQKQAGLGDQPPGNNQHFLLSTRKRSGALAQTGGENRKPARNHFEPPIEFDIIHQAQTKVVSNGEILEQGLLLGSVGKCQSLP